MGRFHAWIYDRTTDRVETECLSAWRAELLAPIEGGVLEIGAGTGRNLAFYGPKVTRLILTEPDRHMRRRLRAKLTASPRAPVAVVVDAAGEGLPLLDHSMDAVVSTLVLCSVDDLARTLAEAWRVLRPGGRLAFLEHVAQERHPRRLRWQRRLEPVWKRVAGNCHLARRTGSAITAAGFEIDWLTEAEFFPAPALVRGSIRGHARRPVS